MCSSLYILVPFSSSSVNLPILIFLTLFLTTIPSPPLSIYHLDWSNSISFRFVSLLPFLSSTRLHQNLLIVNDRFEREGRKGGIISLLSFHPLGSQFSSSALQSHLLFHLRSQFDPLLSIGMIAKQTRRQAPVRILKHQPGLDFKAQQIFHAKRGRKLSIADFSIGQFYFSDFG